MPIDGDEIRERLEEGDLEIDSLDDEQVDAASVNLRLGDSIEILDSGGGIRGFFSKAKRRFTRSGDSVHLAPGEFAVAETEEAVSLPENLGGETKVSMEFGPPGVTIQNTGWVEPGTDGKLRLEIVNNSPRGVRIETGEPILKLIFEEIEETTEEVELIEPELEAEADTDLEPEVEPER